MKTKKLKVIRIPCSLSPLVNHRREIFDRKYHIETMKTGCSYIKEMIWQCRNDEEISEM